ncbi:phage tail tape measure protein [Hoeflea alexandrii]|uniref:phage tail tape measure protein n=1 Tax=Hoeflea alexandrii TaxID=288436 RepID=UPI0035CFD160
MSNRNMNLDVIVRMKDMLSSPLRRLTAGLRSLGNVARSIGIVGTAIAAISFMGPINQAAAFQQQLLDIAGTANLSGQAAFDFVDQAKSEFEELALVVGQYSDTIATGAGQMIASGVNEDLVDASIGSIGRAATAANAQFSDMASVATSLLQTLKLPASQLDDALGGLIVAGKEGAFELKDMARYFPSLTSQMAKFGVTGREAVNFLGAALQIARKGTSDPAEAANNLKNFLSKILAPQTIKKFAEAGVDIEAVMRDAATKGINPVEAVMQKIVKLSGVSGAEIEKLMLRAKANGMEGAEALGFVREQLEKIHGAGALGDLFQDVQVMDFLIPFLGNVDEYKRIKDEVAKATGANIGEDFETQMMGLNRQLVTFKEIGSQAIREVGLAFGTWLPMINGNLSAALKWLRELDKSTGGMVRQALGMAGAVIIAASALGALGFVLPIVGTGLSVLLSPLMLAGRGLFSLGAYFAGAARSAIGLQAALAAMSGQSFGVLGRIAVGLRGMAMAIPGVSALTGILGGIGSAIAAISAPVWGLVAAIAAAGVAVFHYWEPISNFMKGFSSVVGEALSAAWGSFTGFASEMAGLAGEKLLDLAEWLGLDQAKIASRLVDITSTVVDAVKAIPSKVGGFLSEMFSMKDYSDEAEASFRSAGERAGQAMVNAIKGAFGALIEWFRGLPGLIMSAIGKIDLSGILPDWVVNLLPERPKKSSVKTETAAPSKSALLPANNNMLPAQGALAGESKASVAVTIAVEGPGKVTSATSDNKAVKVGNNGRIVGRV